MSIQPADARTALMTSVLLHSLASVETASPRQLLRRPSRNFNTQDIAGHQNQSVSPSKHQARKDKSQARKDKSPFATRGRTIYNAQDKHATPPSPRKSGSRNLNAFRIGSEASLTTQQREEENRRKTDQCFLMEARGDFAYHSDDEDMTGRMSSSDSLCLVQERNGNSRGSRPSLSPPSSTPSDSDVEYSLLRFDVPTFKSGEEELKAMFDMYINKEECLEDDMMGH